MVAILKEKEKAYKPLAEPPVKLVDDLSPSSSLFRADFLGGSGFDDMGLDIEFGRVI